VPSIMKVKSLISCINLNYRGELGTYLWWSCVVWMTVSL